VGYHNYLGFREFAKYGECSKFAALVGHQKLKGFQLQGALLPIPLIRALPRVPAGDSTPDPLYTVGSCSARSPCVSAPHFFDLATPLNGISKLQHASSLTAFVG